MSEAKRKTTVETPETGRAARKYALGLDLGSVSLNTVVFSPEGEILDERYTRTKGLPMESSLRVLRELFAKYPAATFKTLGITGSGGKLLAGLLGGHFVNEIISQAKAMDRLHPEVRTVIEVGGEDSKLIQLEYDKELGSTVIKDFAMNTICAAGTGSFLDQQASRLKLTIEEFGELALKSKHPPRIAGRCSVFAKSDMIHLQQGATPDYDIVAGLCFAMARNFKSTIAKGKQFSKPISFQGGVAANKGMVRAFEEVLELGKGELVIPRYFASMGAIGAALTAVAKGVELETALSLEKLEDYINYHSGREAEGLAKLTLESERLYKNRCRKSVHVPADRSEKVKVYLGIDVGSISTNVVAIDEDKRILARTYRMTAGRPIEAVREGLGLVGGEIGDFAEVCGVCTTGSGRYLTGDFVGADIVRNEITCQAKGAADIDPRVDTIFEIGGQDSKYVSLENGAVVDFEMNKVCAAGTGSFLEEQAEKLNIKIEEEFGDRALGSDRPIRLGERCTVFMESDLVQHQQKGAERDDLIGGLSYSIVANYLNKVVAGKRVGNNIFFQGGVAANDGVVAAFEKVTGKRITVPEHHDVTGAIGAAVLALEANKGKQSTFKGFDLSKKKYEITSFECKDCPNMCEVRQVNVEGEKPLYYGSRCEKYDVEKKSSKAKEVPDLFAEREKFLVKLWVEPGPEVKPDGRKIGVPRALLFHETYPMWHAFLKHLGMEIVLSDKTNKKIIHAGVETVPAETCFPVKVAHGHILNLIEKKPEFIFLPSIVNLKKRNPHIEQSFACPYVQSLPYFANAAFDFEKAGIKVLKPHVYLARGKKSVVGTLRQMGRSLGKSESEIAGAVEAGYEALDRYYAAVHKRGQEVLAGLGDNGRAFVIVSRPYNGCDNGINLELPKKLRDLGALPMPLDYLPIDSVNLSKEWENMYWRYGQKIMSAADIIRKDKRLFAIYITNFGCGPDSFITRFFREKMAGKPYLQIEIDEHSADVGAITRCEAFLDSLEHARVLDVPKDKRVDVVDDSDRLTGVGAGKGKKLYIPSMAPHAYPFAAAFTRAGVEAEVLPESDAKTLEYGRRYTSGKECYPCIVTTGDMVKMCKDPKFDPERSAFFMASGSGPCRFGQYNKLQRLVLKEIGLPNVPIISPNQGREFYKEIGDVAPNFDRNAWRGLLAADFLEKMLMERRPYEVNAGETSKVFWWGIHRVSDAIIKDENIFDALVECRDKMLAVPVERDRQRPLIGIVGEVFVRCNRFSNNNIVVEVERLGGEAWMPPFTEWILYTNFTRKRGNLVRKDYKSYLLTVLKDRVQKHDEHKMKEIFKGAIEKIDEPTTEAVIKLSEDYVHDSFEGEACLSIGKAIDFVNKGASGIINVMPFTCMPGTVVAGVMKRVRQDLDNVPFLNMAYDGLEQTTSITRIEAFMHQAMQFSQARGKKAKEPSRAKAPAEVAA
jgi:predicted CoA-substrate-specific enzyme activase